MGMNGSFGQSSKYTAPEVQFWKKLGHTVIFATFKGCSLNVRVHVCHFEYSYLAQCRRCTVKRKAAKGSRGSLNIIYHIWYTWNNCHKRCYKPQFANLPRPKMKGAWAAISNVLADCCLAMCMRPLMLDRRRSPADMIKFIKQAKLHQSSHLHVQVYSVHVYM